MKAIVSLITLLAIPFVGYCQTPIDKSIPVKAGQNIVLHFDYPEIVRVTTWEKNEISIRGSVSINGGENDDAFVLETSTAGNTITIQNEIKDLKNLPHRITIVDGTETIVFKDKAELKKYQNEHGKHQFERTSWGVDMDIFLEIKVPQNVETQVESVYGMVEIKNFSGPLSVVATYGGVDAALAEKLTGEVTAETNYGEIYTNFDTKFGGDKMDRVRDEAFHTYVMAKPGKGPKYSFESKYGNVYLRKGN